MKILICGTGSISAHKLPTILSAIKSHCNNVELGLLLTESALKYTTVDSLLYSLGGQYDKFWNNEYMAHIKSTDNIDKFIVLPASYNTIGKIANGIADNEVTCAAARVYSSHNITKIIFPAMNCHMWESKILHENLDRLLYHGWIVVDPVVGRMACGEYGKGVLPDTRKIVNLISTLSAKMYIYINFGIPPGFWYSNYSGDKFKIIGISKGKEAYVDPSDPKLPHETPGCTFSVHPDHYELTYLIEKNRIDINKTVDE